jgi:hypothetical protein
LGLHGISLGAFERRRPSVLVDALRSVGATHGDRRRRCLIGGLGDAFVRAVAPRGFLSGRRPWGALALVVALLLLLPQAGEIGRRHFDGLERDVLAHEAGVEPARGRVSGVRRAAAFAGTVESVDLGPRGPRGAVGAVLGHARRRRQGARDAVRLDARRLDDVPHLVLLLEHVSLPLGQDVGDQQDRRQGLGARDADLA